ncbi:MAG: hypothetical protein ABFS10_01010 [Bacteroidota bacterium]
MKNFLVLFSAMILMASCSDVQKPESTNQSPVDESTIKTLAEKLVEAYGVAQSERIEKGVNQAASLWRADNGDEDAFHSFVMDNYIGDPEELDQVFEKVSRNIEILFGHFNKIGLDLQSPLHLDMGPIHKIDQDFGAYNPGAHLSEDLYNNRIAFMIALNFPGYSLDEKNELGASWSRKQWAYARLGDLFTSRIPPELMQNYAQVSTNSEIYISGYNIFVGQLLDRENNALFDPGMQLLLHWNLRDEIKSNYNEEGLEKQRLIYEAMKRIIYQEIPAAVINSEEYTWNPYTNETFKDGNRLDLAPEDNERYNQILGNFRALKAMDPYEPEMNTFLKRSFAGEKEISQEDVTKLFTEFASSPLLKEVAGLIKKELGRDLEAYDIWYDGFKPRSGIDAARLDDMTSKKYPSPEAFEKDLPEILVKLGFDTGSAREITSHIVVDAARGSGHAWGASMKSEKAHLRTRIGKDGMDYKGYNIAVHEFGHNVEQTISLHDVDYYILNGVPNTGFTEALAFVFQKQDLKLLGMDQPDPLYSHKEVLDDFWVTFEIMGVSLVDMRVWEWMYANEDATPEQLKEATIRIAKEVWNEYFAPVFGVENEPILAVYSHMVSYPLYLANYAIGSLIQFQVEQHLKGKDFAAEVGRIYSLGKLTPQEWMKEAVGNELSADPMLLAAGRALEALFEHYDYDSVSY